LIVCEIVTVVSHHWFAGVMKSCVVIVLFMITIICIILYIYWCLQLINK